jgi:predicted transcriptional regulator
MISLNNHELLQAPIKDFVISSEKVAHVQLMNSAEHALLVLTRTGYSVIPVLDPKYRLHGLLSMKMITESILGLKRIEYEKLETICVSDIMDSDVAFLHVNDTFQRALDLVIDHAFLCVVDDDDMFVGILTRRVILKQLKKHIYTNN